MIDHVDEFGDCGCDVGDDGDGYNFIVMFKVTIVLMHTHTVKIMNDADNRQHNKQAALANADGDTIRHDV